jgi:hypothetical protein
MFDLFATILRVLFRGFQSRHQLMLENLPQTVETIFSASH